MELLVVIGVVAILFAIVTVAYNGVRNNAIEASMRSDLKNVAELARVASAKNGTPPADLDATGFPDNGDNIIDYQVRPYGYCVTVSSDEVDSEYSIRSNNNGIIEDGNCQLSVAQYAGSGVNGFANGTSETAAFTSVSGIVMDSKRNIFVADEWNHRIRMIAPDGTVSTFVGSGANANIQATGLSAAIDRPQGLVIDSQDNLYTSSGNLKIKITPAGVVTHITNAANGIAGAIDADGTLYVYDFTNHVIRKVTSTGVVSTLAGLSGTSGYVNATGTSARFNNPTSLTLSESGDVYVADRGNNRIRKITPSGEVSSYAGSGAGGIDIVDGPAATATIGELRFISMDNTGTIWILSKNDITRLRADVRILS